MALANALWFLLYASFTLFRPVALANFMRLSLMKAAHVDLAGVKLEWATHTI